MPKTLYLVRHAQAASPDGQQTDHNRPLTQAGRRDATRLGNYLQEQSIELDTIITSTAVRAVETAESIAERIEFSLDKIIREEELYEASIRILLQAVNGIDDKFTQVMLISHNPSISFLADYLTNDDMGSMSPGTMIALKFDLESWAEVSQNTGHTITKRNPD